MALLIVIAAAMGFIGARLSWLGWRGRCTNFHPTCRRCGFDLFGLPTSATACSECGADLRVRGSIVAGQWVHRWPLLGPGAAMLIPAFVVIAIILFGALTNVDWQGHKPLRLLAIESKSSDPSTQSYALRELLVRERAGKLSKAQIAQLIDDGLQVQSRADDEWSPWWGDFIEQAQRDGNVSASQWKTYAHQSLAPWVTLTVGKIERDTGIPYHLNSSLARVGHNEPILFAALRFMSVRIDGQEMLPKGSVEARGVSLYDEVGRYLDDDFPAVWFAQLDPGPHSGSVTIEITIRDRTPPPTTLGRIERTFPIEINMPPKKSTQ